MPKNEKLLQEIKDNFQYALDSWRDIREEAKKDMRAIAGDPWPASERAKREDPDSLRPILTLDELTQYVNQLINQVRQNPIAVKVSPKGDGATDKTAEMRQGLIRAIEYKSKAQAAYINAFENAAQRSYGYFVITTGYVSDKSFDQEIKVRLIPNPDSVLIDPDCKEADTSDKTFSYILDSIPTQSFESKYPNAEIKSFTPEMENDLPDWIKADSIQTAEYWKLKKEQDTLFLVDDSGNPTPILKSELDNPTIESGRIIVPGGRAWKILKDRKIERQSVCQYITNGVEILEENEWAGKWIPIVSVFGKQLYVDKGAGSKRMLISLVRMARDPFLAYCVLRSNEVEEGGMTPKTPFICYEGQLEGHEDEWAKVSREPLAFLQVKAVPDNSPNGGVLPLPVRQPFQPNFAAYEVVCEAFRRAIQAAMGISPLPTAAQRQNEKSGIALQRINQQEQIGSFHFIDNYKRSIEFAGRIYDDLIGKIYDTARDVGIRNPDESHETLKLNQPYEENGEQIHHDTSVGEHEITISTGPSYDSQREEVADFASTLANTDLFPRIADLVIRLRNLGPLGDEMADRVTPPEFAKDANPSAKLAQTQQQLMQQQEAIQEMQVELKKLQLEKAGKVIEMQAKQQMHQLDIALETAKLDNARAIAEIQTKAQIISEREAAIREVDSELHGSAHEVALQKDQQAHEKGMADQQHQQAMEQGQQGHEQALEQGDQAGAQQAALAQQQAENQPSA